MATLNDIQILADELTLVSPPPAKPKGVNFTPTGNGRWIVQRTGAGMFALRAEYPISQNETCVIKIDSEITGYPNALISALKFAIMIAKSSTYFWAAT